MSLPNLCNGATISEYGSLRVTYSDNKGSTTVRDEVQGRRRGPQEYVSGTGCYGYSDGAQRQTRCAHRGDAAGNETVSAPCEWNVQNPTYTVGFAAPTVGQTVNGTVTLRAPTTRPGAVTAAGLASQASDAVARRSRSRLRRHRPG